MHLDCTPLRAKNGKTYRRAFLRESYRDARGRVQKRTVANLSHLDDDTLARIRLALAGDAPLPTTNPATLARDLHLRQGPSWGALTVLQEVARREGVVAALGGERAGRLTLWQVLARTLTQGSRLAAVRLAQARAADVFLDLGPFSEDTLYANLDWLAAAQPLIEDALFALRYGPERRPPPGLFLYDVTSSYFEGTQNALAAFGYCRDGKKGKRQLVVGLLTDAEGWPLSVEVFRGNTADPATVASQVQKLARRFGGGPVTLVGDRGMLRGPQVAELTGYGLHYLTAITKPEIAKLLAERTLQPELFDQDLAEVVPADATVRYIVRRNPHQVKRCERRREDQLATWRAQLQARNTFLAGHPRARVATAKRTLTALAQRLKLAPWLSVRARGRVLHEVLDEDGQREASKLAGCYVLKTDLAPAQLSKELADARYRGLAQVERAFRTCKTGHLEQRPVFVRLDSRTRGHIFVVMLSYLLVKSLEGSWRHLNFTVKEGLRELEQVAPQEVQLKGQPLFVTLPEPPPATQALLTAVGVKLKAPHQLPVSQVVTKHLLQSQRK